MHAPRVHGRRGDRVREHLRAVAVERLGLLRVGGIRRRGTTHVVTRAGAAHGEVVRGPQHRASIPATAIFGGASWGTLGYPGADLLRDDDLAVVAYVVVGAVSAARPPAAEAAVGCGKTREIRVV